MADIQTYDVYISYSMKDIEFAQKVLAALQASGLNVFIYLDNLTPGENWVKITQQALRNSKTLVALLSPDAVNSANVRREIDFALSISRMSRIAIFPVIVRPIDYQAFTVDSSPYDGFDLSALRDIVYLDMSKGEFSESIAQLIQAIQTRLGIPEKRTPANTGRKGPIKKSAPGNITIGQSAEATDEPPSLEDDPATERTTSSVSEETTAPSEAESPQTQNTERPEPFIQHHFEHRLHTVQHTVEIGVALTTMGWRIPGVDGTLIANMLNFDINPTSFFGQLLEDIPENQRANLISAIKTQINERATVLRSDGPAVFPIPDTLAPALFPNTKSTQAAVIACEMGQFKYSWLENSQAGSYFLRIIREAVIAAGKNNVTHLVMPVIGLYINDSLAPDEQTKIADQHILNIINMLVHISDFGTLTKITILAKHPRLVLTAGVRLRRLTAELAALRQNNRAQAVSNDRPLGEDQLEIKNEVDALADTILLREVEPPVAVGIIGTWGSGKSFVMHLLKERVNETRAKAVKKGWPDQTETNPPTFVGHVYQIQFNAWTYAKSNLWASLMDTIFSSLSRQLEQERWLSYKDIEPPADDNSTAKAPPEKSDAPPSPEQLSAQSILGGGQIYKKIYQEVYQPSLDPDLSDKQKDNLEKWSSKLLSKTLLWQAMRSHNENIIRQLRNAEAELARLKTRREALEKTQATKGHTANELKKNDTAWRAYIGLLKATLKDFFSDAFGKSISKALKNRDLNESRVQTDLENMARAINGYQGLWAALRQNKYYILAGVSVAVILLVLPKLFELIGQPIVDYALAQIAAVISVALPVVRAILVQAQKILEFEQKTQKALDEAYEIQLKNEKIQEAQDVETIMSKDGTLDEKIQALNEKIEAGSLPALDALIALRESQIENQRQRVGPSAKYANLLEFVRSRLDAATYENQLGLMHQVRRDIDELTYSLVDHADPDVFPRGKPRIILYIDDLDRCPPSRVVEVLEAVQLLLNTELFVVVLGLDTRYIARALVKEYKEILQHDGDPSGLDYIEKIIQIPYRVRPISQSGVQKYLRGQMKIKVVESPSDSTLQPSLTPSKPQEPQPNNQPIQTNPHVDPIDKDQEPNQADLDALEKLSSGSLEDIELPPAVIEFAQEDLDDLNACCVQIALSPRSIKRIVNVFKLMKIFWFRSASSTADDYDQKRVVKQAAMVLLALSSAYPEIMREAFVKLEALYRRGEQTTPLFDELDKITVPSKSEDELRGQLKRYKMDLAGLRAIKGNGQDNFGQLTLDVLQQPTFNIICSFSFVGDAVYWQSEEKTAVESAIQKPA